jgi:hypothetical protein
MVEMQVVVNGCAGAGLGLVAGCGRMLVAFECFFHRIFSVKIQSAKWRNLKYGGELLLQAGV